MLQKLRYNQNQKGFTLIELMIVIAIIGILAAIAIPQFNAYRRRSKTTKSLSMLEVIRSAQGGLNYDVGGFGSTQQGDVLNSTIAANAGAVLDGGLAPLGAAPEAVAGRQLAAEGTDPTGNPFVQSFPIDVPQGIITQVSVNANLGTTYNAEAWAYTTDRQYGLDFDAQQTVYYLQDPAPPAWISIAPLAGALPNGAPLAPTPADDYLATAGVWKTIGN